MWVVFVLAAGAVLFAVAAVAVGRGDGLVEAPPDRRPLTLPDGPLTAAHLERVRLAVGLRGYRMDEVDALLDRVGAELDRRDARIRDLEAAVIGTGTGGSPDAPATRRTDASEGDS